jgi:hypothetical protein
MTQGQYRRVSDVAASLIRTFVPVAVGAAVTWLALHWHIIVPADISAQAVPAIAAAITAAYYAAARWLERRRSTGHWLRLALAAQWLGRWMLGGTVVQPVYAPPGRQVFEMHDGQTRRLR